MKNPKYIALPNDEQGFLYRLGDDDFEASIAVGEVSLYAYYYMNELCLFVNTIDIMRKKYLSYVKALNLAHFSSDELPFINAITHEFEEEFYVAQSDEAVSFKNMKAETFAIAIASADFARRDDLIEQYKAHLYEMVDYENPEEYDSALFEYYFAYIEYAFDELLAHWADAKCKFIAPIFATAPLDPEIFGCDSKKIIATSYIPTIDIMSIFDTETRKIEDGTYENGEFVPLKQDFLSDFFHYYENLPKIETEHVDFEDEFDSETTFSDNLDEEIEEYL